MKKALFGGLLLVVLSTAFGGASAQSSGQMVSDILLERTSLASEAQGNLCRLFLLGDLLVSDDLLSGRCSVLRLPMLDSAADLRGFSSEFMMVASRPGDFDPAAVANLLKVKPQSMLLLVSERGLLTGEEEMMAALEEVQVFVLQRQPRNLSKFRKQVKLYLQIFIHDSFFSQLLPPKVVFPSRPFSSKSPAQERRGSRSWTPGLREGPPLPFWWARPTSEASARP